MCTYIYLFLLNSVIARPLSGGEVVKESTMLNMGMSGITSAGAHGTADASSYFLDVSIGLTYLPRQTPLELSESLVPSQILVCVLMNRPSQ